MWEATPLESPWFRLLQKKGIVVGRRKLRKVSNVERAALQAQGLELETSYVHEYNQVMVQGNIYRTGENVVVNNPDSMQDWLGRIFYIFVAFTSTGADVFFAGEYYRMSFYTSGELNGLPEKDHSSGMVITVPGMEVFDKHSILHISSIKREICMVPCRDGKRAGCSIALETSTVLFPDRLLQRCRAGTVPFYPLAGDVVEVHNKEGTQRWFAVVLTTDEETKVMTLQWLRQLTNEDIFALGNKEVFPQSWDVIVRRLNVQKYGTTSRDIRFVVNN